MFEVLIYFKILLNPGVLYTSLTDDQWVAGLLYIMNAHFPMGDSKFSFSRGLKAAY